MNVQDIAHDHARDQNVGHDLPIGGALVFQTERRLAIVLVLVGGLVLLLSPVAPIDPSGRLVTEAKKTQAQLGCKALSQACEAYRRSISSSADELPAQLNELLDSPSGREPFLRNGEKDLLDPWGKPFEMERRTQDDGTTFALVHTTAPDGTPISQYGIGPASR